MGFLDGLLGRRKPARPNLDALFALPTAAITLQVSFDMEPTGRGAVAFRAPEGRAFADVEADVRALLDADEGPPVELVSDDYGYTWIVVTSQPPDVSAIVTDLHAVNSTLADTGFGPTLLCSHVSFADPHGRRLAMVYLYKQGTFYPFVPAGESTRDNMLELQVRDALAHELPVEPDLARWFALWGLPGL